MVKNSRKRPQMILHGQKHYLQPIWHRLRPFWTIFDSFFAIYFLMATFDPILEGYRAIVIFAIKMLKNGQKWIIKVANGTKWIASNICGHIGPFETVCDQFCPF